MSETSTAPKLRHAKRNALWLGNNSWAQEAEKNGVMEDSGTSGLASIRDKYEDKPMPSLPPPERALSPPGPGRPGHIRPATPLNYLGLPASKDRAATDPAATKGLSRANKITAEFRARFLNTKKAINTQIPGGLTTSIMTPKTPKKPKTSKTPESQTQPTGGRNVNQMRRESPPSSAPANADVPDQYRSSGTPGRQTNSTPVPTRRYLRENNIPTSVLTQAAAIVPQVAYDDADPGSDESGMPEGIIVGDGNLKPTVDGTYGTLRQVEVVEGKAVHKVASFAAVIGNTESSPTVTEGQQHQRSTTKTPSNRDSLAQDNTMLLPVAYSPSEYGGVWENDPHVGQTLPPFSPMPPGLQQSAEQMHGLSQNTHGPGPSQAVGPFEGPAIRVPDFAPSMHSNNSWSPMPGPSNMHFQAAPPPLFSNGPIINAVPPPPSSYRGFQPGTGPVSAELNMFELNIHHHIDTCFGTLSRMVTDKIDQSMDQLIRHLEDSEQKHDKQFKIVKNGVKEIQEKVHYLHEDVRTIKEANERGKNSLDGAQAKFEDIKAEVEKIDDKLEQLHVGVTGLSTTSGGDGKGLVDMEQKLREVVGKIDRLVEHTASGSQGSGVSPRRVQSASNPSPTYYGQRQQYHSGASNSSMGPRNSNASSRGRRSNPGTANGAPNAADGRGARRDYYAELGHSMGEAPDLRQHPAFQHSQQHMGYDANGHPVGLAADGSIYQAPGFLGRDPSGWYQQAYGS